MCRRNGRTAIDEHASLIHDSAVRTPTPQPPSYDHLLTGHERRRQDRCWRPRGTEDWLLIHTLSGSVRLALPDRELLLGSGDTVLYQPGATQDFGGDASSAFWEVVWAHFVPRPDWLELVRRSKLAPGVLHMWAPKSWLLDRIEACLLETDRLAVSGLPQAHRLALNALETALLWMDILNPARRRLDPRVVEALEYLSHNLHRRVSVGELAHAVHLSPSRLAHLFRQETGMTPRGFAERQRLWRAMPLLEVTQLPVNKVARQASFENQFDFAALLQEADRSTPE